jgi:hypothetical protein
MNYGDSRYTSFIRERLKLRKGLQGYALSVLLKHAGLPPWAELSPADERLADVADAPTRTNLFQYIVDLAGDGYSIDLFIFAHGWREQFGRHASALDGEDRISADDIETELHSSQTGFSSLPIRVIWGANCYGQSLGAAWRSVGALATAGARYVNFYPAAWNNFIEAWNQGDVPFDQAVAHADTSQVRVASQDFIASVDAAARWQCGTWGGCPFGKAVLGDGPCAKEYFGPCWLAEDEWQPGLSGGENMNYSSHMFCSGERQITKSAVRTWR